MGHGFKNGDQLLALFVAALRAFLKPGHPLFDAIKVGNHQFCVDGVSIANGINRPVDVCHLTIETAQHVKDGVGFANVCQKLVAQALALAGAAHQASNIDNL